MRVFVGISMSSLSFDPRTAFRKVRIGLEQKEIEHRWVPAENYHITLCFLGEVEEDTLASIKEELMFLSRGHAPFELRVEGMGVFPQERSGRVVWVGVQNSMALRALQRDCEVAMKGLGFELEEKEFKPHLTVARLRSPRNLKDIISPLKNQEFGTLAVDHVTLFESKVGGGFPIYEPIGTFDLGQNINHPGCDTDHGGTFMELRPPGKTTR